MLSEITRGALDPEGWQPLIDARPDWFEVIHLYGTKSGWERRKQLSLTRIPLHDTSTLLTGSPPPLATSMPTGSPAAPRRRDRDGQSTRRLLQAATIMPVRIRQEVQALPRGDGRIALSCCQDPLCYPCPSSGASTRSQRPPFFRPFQFFDHTRLNHGALCIFAVQLVLIRSEPGICQLAHRWSANQFSTKRLSSRTRWCRCKRKRKIAKRNGIVVRKNASAWVETV
jgi:hypothetical protein